MATRATDPPESVRSAIAKLWRASLPNPQLAAQSAAFRLLVDNCRATYAAIHGSRLQQSRSSALQSGELHSAIRRFFRWCGAPWYDSDCPAPDEVALRLHSAFLTPDIDRVYLVPLDQLDLKAPTRSRSSAPEDLRFGSNVVCSMTCADLHRLVPVDGIKRFGPRYVFPADRLDGFNWLVVRVHEDAGPFWKRTPLRWFHTSKIGAIGESRMYQPTYPAPVEDALFILLLTLAKQPTETPWRPFVVPWIYSFADDPFALPQRAPEPSSLTWALVGDAPSDDTLVPDHLWQFHVTRQALDELQRRQSEFETTSAKRGASASNLSPLVQHFFVRAFAENGIHEIIANLSCFEATLMRGNERGGRRRALDRLTRLTGNQHVGQWLQSGYRLRDDFLHSLGQPSDSVDSRNLAQIRWSVCQAVREYLSFASKHPDRSRDELLDELLSPRPG